MTPNNPPLSPRYCAALNKKGKRCGKLAVMGNKFCSTHAPEYAGKLSTSLASANKALADRRSRRPKELKTIDDMIAAQAFILEKIMIKAHKGSLNSKEIQSFATIGRSWIKSKMEQEKLTRLKDLEDRTKSLVN